LNKKKIETNDKKSQELFKKLVEHITDTCAMIYQSLPPITSWGDTEMNKRPANINWISNGIKVESWDAWEHTSKPKSYNQIEIINAFLYFIDLRGIVKVETESWPTFLGITLKFEDGAPLSSVIKRLNKGIREFEKFTGYDVSTSYTQGEASKVKGKIKRNAELDHNVVVSYNVIIVKEDNKKSLSIKEVDSNRKIIMNGVSCAKHEFQKLKGD
jgi:hypothetical protein